MRPRHLLTLLLTIFAVLLLTASSDPPPTPTSTEQESELWAAFTRRLESLPAGASVTFDLFTPELDAAFVSPNGDQAVLWLALRDDYGNKLATEPGLVVGQLTDQGWQVLLPGDPGWDETLFALPPNMLPAELSPAPDAVSTDPDAYLETLTGYYLPYVAGSARWLEGSIGHFQDIPWLGYPSCLEQYCRYAYDFTDEGHFPLLASKGGMVFASRDTCPDNGTYCTNFIVLQDTANATYQIYMHMAHATIPDKLTPGAIVQRGQYLGDTDDTGYSTSQHVHFMVTNSIWLVDDGYYWGASIDIRFADVTINNGIPRTCYEVTQFPIYDGAAQCLGNPADPLNPNNDWFISGNVGAYPPTGTLTRPAAGATVALGSNPLMDVTANASDDVRVTQVQLLAKIGGKWIAIGPKVTQPLSPGVFDWDVDLCAVGPLNGELEVALRVWDHEGNRSGVLSPRTILVDHACPPPTSQLKPAGSFNSTAVRLSWDAANAGAGFGSFELQWRT
ncbi:MAG: peptidoglycan DD-metalloendopeptidase family protein, partial [Anaerolineaceae bacterium]